MFVVFIRIRVLLRVCSGAFIPTQRQEATFLQVVALPLPSLPSPSLAHFFTSTQIQLGGAGALYSALSGVLGGAPAASTFLRILNSQNTSHGSTFSRSCAMQMTVFR